ncbi:MAG: acetate kinase [Bacteroidales bacterium]|nr:acetate kinase [Bacteroidales bacterium]MDT8432169.1 acetate kinase [Bacteroidales bacterium]
MVILVLNCGSSSVKYQLFNMNEETEVVAKGIVERIGFNDAILNYKPAGKEKISEELGIPDHTVAIDKIFQLLTDKEIGVIKDLKEIKAVGHRVVQGGESYKESVLITKDVIRDVEANIELAPLHNPANLKGIMSVENLLPGIPQVAVFDTSFHQTMPPHAYMYAIPMEFYKKYKIRKYGYHGTSHKYVSRVASNVLGKDTRDMKLVTCHLGNGASVTAVEYGKSIDTSMGFTPVDGLIMGTRTGDIDPGILLFLADKEHLSLKGVSNMINKNSGMKGVSGISSDMRDLELAYYEGNEMAALALNMYTYRIKKFIGAYAAIMNGLDAVIFTGGVGENDFNIRRMICQNMDYLGLMFDEVANHGIKGQNKLITKPESRVKAAVVRTNEELLIATDTYKILEKCV